MNKPQSGSTWHLDTWGGGSKYFVEPGRQSTATHSPLPCTSVIALILSCCSNYQLEQHDTNSKGELMVFVSPSQKLGWVAKPLTCDKDFLHGVAFHVPSPRDECHFILCVWPQVSNRILVFILGEVNSCPVPWNVFGAISELYDFNVSQGFGPRDKSCGVCDIFCLDLARGIKFC